MLSPNSESDVTNLFYHHITTENHNKLKSYIDLAEYISKGARSYIFLTDKGYACLKADEGITSFKSFTCLLSLLPNERGSISEIPDILLDSHFFGNPLLSEFPSVRFFAALLLINDRNEVLGYLTVQDDKPNSLDQGQKAALLTLADQLVTYLDDNAKKQIHDESSSLWVARNMDQGVTISDLNGKVIWVNNAFSQLTGYTLQEIAGKAAGTILSGQNTNMAAVYMTRAQSHKQKTFNLELLAYQKSGKPYWLSVQTSFTSGDGRKEGRIIEIFTDITDKKQKDIELKTLAMAIGKSSGGVTVLESNGRLVWMNEAFERISGYSFAELEGTELDSLFLLFTGGSANLQTAKRIKKAIKSHLPYEAELEIRTKDQIKKWILINSNPVFDKAGKIERTVNSITDITSRKKTELELIRFSEVVNQSSNAIIFRDLNGKVTWVNEAYKQYFGYTSEEAIGTSYYELLSGKDTDKKQLKTITNKIRSGKGGTLDLTLYHKDGSPVSIIGTLKPIIGKSGKTESAASILTDVSEIKKAENEIKKLSLVATESPDGLLVRDSRGIALWVNKAFEKTSGYIASEIIGKDVSGLFTGPATDLKAHKQAIKKRSKGEESSTELLLYKKDGAAVWIRLLTYPILNGQGKIESMVTLTQDITERKKIDEDLRMLSLVASKTIIGVAINDRSGKVVWCNPSFEKISGYSLEEVKGKLLGNVMKGRDTDLKELKAVREIGNQKKSFYTELLSYKKDGSPFWLAVSSTAVLDENGGLTHQVDIVDDITVRKEAELQLIKLKDEALHLSKAKEMFLSVMSHEIRTPLNTVNGITQLLLDDGPTKTQQEYLKLLKFSGENLTTLINDILDLTKMETGNLILEKTTVNLHELLNNTISSLQVKAAENSTNLILNIGKKVPLMIKGDSVRLYQILMNLTGNSIKFTSNGKVKVSVKLIHEANSTVKIGFKIADTGIGIPADKLETIFDAYTQASTDTTRKFGGTGLGLTITRNLLKIHGSEITVSSKVGKGSAFSFEIEFDKDTQPIRAPEPSQIATLPILVVDDNEINRKIAQRVLSGLYQQIDFAENGEIAVKKIRETRYACVLMDVFMPVMDGIEATEIIRNLADPYYKNLPIIALTGSTDESDLQNINNCGMNGHIVKPLTKDNLSKILGHSKCDLTCSDY